MDRGGPDAAAVLAVVAARCAASATAVIVTTSVPLGLRAELRIAGLSQADLAAAIRMTGEDTAHALWMASRGLPGVALPLARELTQEPGSDRPPGPAGRAHRAPSSTSTRT